MLRYLHQNLIDQLWTMTQVKIYASTFFLHLFKCGKGTACIYISQHFIHLCGSPGKKELKKFKHDNEIEDV